MSTEPTNEAIRIACCEQMGWKFIGPSPTHHYEHSSVTPSGSHIGLFNRDGRTDEQLKHDLVNLSPNYPECDKAARELRMSLTEEEQAVFANRLVLDLKIDWQINKPEGQFKLLNASPRDQAIAYLRTKGIKI